MSDGYLTTCPLRGPCTLSRVWLSCTTRSAPLSTLTVPSLPTNSLWKPEGVPGLQARVCQRIFHAFQGDARCRDRKGGRSRRYLRRSLPRPGSPLRPRTSVPSPRRRWSAARSARRRAGCAGGRRRPRGFPPAAHRKSAAVAPLSLAASTARCPSILSFLAGGVVARHRAFRLPARGPPLTSPCHRRSGRGLSRRRARSVAPPSAATIRSAPPRRPGSGAANRERRSGRSRPARLGGRRAPVAQLPGRRLRRFERLQQHDHDRRARCRGSGPDTPRCTPPSTGRVPALGRVGGEEDHAREEVADEARQHGDRGAQDRPPHRGLEEPCEPETPKASG